jgi:hypothetical protein
MNFEYDTGIELCNQKSFKFWIPFALFCFCVAAILFFAFGEGVVLGISFQSRVFVFTFLGLISVFSFGVMAFHARNLCMEKQIVSWEILNY